MGDKVIRKRNIQDELKQSIMRGIYKPRERLMERDLAERFGVSRTPVREAFRELEKMGMLRIIPNRGAIVADLSKEDIESLFLLRSHLEQFAASLACGNATSHEINDLIAIHQEFRQIISSDNFFEITKKDKEFHLTICQFSRNSFLTKVIEELRLKSDWFRYHYWKNKKDFQFMISGHAKMIEALRKKDSKELCLLVKMHLDKAKNEYLMHSGLK
jgi:DNA-binding GntR family transcriptional regulator